MQVDWTKHLKTPEERERFKSSVLSARPVLERLNDLLSEYQASGNKSLENISSYESPSWAYRAADQNGFNRAFSMIKALINLDQQKAKYD